MPLALILVVIDITLVIHAAKTGRFSPWGFIILMIWIYMANLILLIGAETDTALEELTDMGASA